jgi:hypothetical protein
MRLAASVDGPLQRSWNVGDRGKRGLVVLNASFVTGDP